MEYREMKERSLEAMSRRLKAVQKTGIKKP